MIGSSVLPAGTRLPTIRQLARDLRVARDTVARAYQELERSGAVATRGRHGTFVAGPIESQLARNDLDRAAETLAPKGLQLGMTADQLATLLWRAFRAVAPLAWPARVSRPAAVPPRPGAIPGLEPCRRWQATGW